MSNEQLAALARETAAEVDTEARKWRESSGVPFILRKAADTIRALIPYYDDAKATERYNVAAKEALQRTVDRTRSTNERTEDPNNPARSS